MNVMVVVVLLFVVVLLLLSLLFVVVVVVVVARGYMINIGTIHQFHFFAPWSSKQTGNGSEPLTTQLQ